MRMLYWDVADGVASMVDEVDQNWDVADDVG